MLTASPPYSAARTGDLPLNNYSADILTRVAMVFAFSRLTGSSTPIILLRPWQNDPSSMQERSERAFRSSKTPQLNSEQSILDLVVFSRIGHCLECIWWLVRIPPAARQDQARKSWGLKRFAGLQIRLTSFATSCAPSTHETVHTFQPDPAIKRLGNTLLSNVLIEGAADFIATLVTGRPIDLARAAWATPREADLWRQFEADLAVTRGVDWSKLKRGTPAATSFSRWIGNYHNAPEGWPTEAGYWMGQRVWQRWYDRQSDKRAAMREMLTLTDPSAVLAGGNFEETHLLR